MTRRARTWLLLITAAGVSLITMIVVIPHVLRYRRPDRIRIIEELDHAVAVTGWSEQGLELADGRLVRLPGLLKLPQASTALTESIRCGVEIDEHGRVYGLVRVHHWCGNDPVGEHIARVDLARMLTFFGEGEPKDRGPRRFHFADDGSTRAFTPWGWNVSLYNSFMRVER